MHYVTLLKKKKRGLLMAWVASLPMSCNIVRKIPTMSVARSCTYAATACGAIIFTFSQGFQAVRILICGTGVWERPWIKVRTSKVLVCGGWGDTFSGCYFVTLFVCRRHNNTKKMSSVSVS